MIVQYGDRFREWSGLSTDTKPTAGVRPGDEFVEINTGKRFKYDRDGEVWVEYIPKFEVEAELKVSDIQIGAVEIKDGVSDNRVNVDTEGNLSVKNQNKYEDIIFHNLSSTPNAGLEFEVGDYKNLRVGISGTATSHTLLFKGESGEVITDLSGIREVGLLLGSNTTLLNEVWEFDIEGYEKVWFGLSAVAGGNITVKGRAVN